MKIHQRVLSVVWLLITALLPVRAATYKGTITVEMGKTTRVNIGTGYMSSEVITSGYWDKSNSTFIIESVSGMSQKECTIKGNKVGTGKLYWTGYIFGDDWDFYWDVIVKPVRQKLTLSAIPKGSRVRTGQKVALQASNSAATIYYSLDGKNPLEYPRHIYQEGEQIAIDHDLTLKAIAVHPDYYDSNVLSEDYTVDYSNGDIFTVKTKENIEMTFRIISTSKKTCEAGTGSSDQKAIKNGNIQTITVPSEINGYKVVGISQYAFAVGYYLHDIVVSEGIEYIDADAFSNSGLKNISIPKSIQYISPSAFQNCEQLKGIKVSNGNPIYDSRDNCNALVVSESNTLIKGGAESKIPESVVEVAPYAFCQNKAIRNISFPSTLQTIGKYAFYWCESLEDFVLPATLTYIGTNAFARCSNMTKLCIPGSVATIPESAFRYCGKLSSLVLEEGVSYIEKGAFRGCEKLTNVQFPSTLKSIENTIDNPGSSFSGCPMTTITTYARKPYIFIGPQFSEEFPNNEKLYVPKGTKTYYNQLWKTDLSKIHEIENDNTVLFSEIEEHDVNVTYVVLSEKEKTCAVFDIPLLKIDGKSAREVTIPETVNGYAVKSIGYRAYTGDTYLDHVNNITIPTSISSIEEYALNECYLTTITSLSEYPAEISETSFMPSTFERATLYVPNGRKTCYESTEGWNKFKNIVETVTSDIKDIPKNATVVHSPIYNLSGQRLDKPRKGINIIGGKKVIVK